MSAERITHLDDARKRRQLEDERIRRLTAYELGKDFTQEPPPAAPFFDIKPRIKVGDLSLTVIILSMWTLTLMACTLVVVFSR